MEIWQQQHNSEEHAHTVSKLETITTAAAATTIRKDLTQHTKRRKTTKQTKNTHLLMGNYCVLCKEQHESDGKKHTHSRTSSGERRALPKKN